MTARKTYRAALLEARELTNYAFRVHGRQVHTSSQLPMDVDLPDRIAAIRLNTAQAFRQSGHRLAARSALKK